MYLNRLMILIRATTELSERDYFLMSYTASWLTTYCQLHKHKCWSIILNWRAKVLPHCQLLKLSKYRNPTPCISSVHSPRGWKWIKASVTGASHWPHRATDPWIRTSNQQPSKLHRCKTGSELINNNQTHHTSCTTCCKLPGHCNWDHEFICFKGTRVENY